MASFRHLTRIAVLQSLFAVDQHNINQDEILQYLLTEFHTKIQDHEFAKTLFYGVIEKKDTLSSLIKEKAPQWPLEKIAIIDRNVLYIGIYEMLYCEDIPDVVSINESIELAKEFGSSNSSKFVNGVLSAIINDKKEGKL